MNNLIVKIRIILKKYFPKIYNISLPLRNFIYKTFYTKKSQINLSKEFQEFVPNVTGDINKKDENTIYNIKNFSNSASSLFNSEISIENLNTLSKGNERKLGDLFNKYGSDKKTHEYDYLYEMIIDSFESIDLLIEIGIGSNNKEIISNMSEYGQPGASLRAFRDFLTDTKIVGLEYDKDVLFEESNIKTFFYDQNSNQSVEEFSEIYKNKVDILIDDGLHSIVANTNSVLLAKSILKKDGYLIIEDISQSSINLYKIIFELIKDFFETKLYTNKSCFVATLKKY